jgi:hypothetical protein
MKITNKNILYWLSGLVFLIWCYSIWIYGIPEEPCLIGALNIIGFLFFVVVGSITLILYCAILIRMCLEDEIKFEIDLLKPFRTRHIPPEEEDKQNK